MQRFHTALKWTELEPTRPQATCTTSPSSLRGCLPSAYKRQIFKLEPRVDSVAVAAPDNPVARSWMALQRRIIGDYWGRTVPRANKETLATVEELDDHVILREPYALPPGVGPVHIILDCVSNGAAASGITQTAQGVYGEKLHPTETPISFLGSNAGCFAVQDWKTQMPEVLHMISVLEAPFEMFIAPLSEVASAWESEAALIERLVVIPGLLMDCGCLSSLFSFLEVTSEERFAGASGS
ncbi:uncharacterized protein BDW43DRAFT_313105 [Aspergillus alliaceus]|uniref:uncharacterized protein n=1 Tax=Petromyces alliaceus TaxID=209559 RepID=UPI0012A3CE03|nr:uncharacterized protein BDW43DRAFT_313105 [Aspergillus alliaceus]KAB8231293.1 hypothetical protein BDW43DRAFT_313105 [Aspergillus alliaceus]